MPRRNKPKKEPQAHVATVYDKNYKRKCYGCAFAGRDFACMSSDGQCLKEPRKAEPDNKKAITPRHSRKI